MKGFISYIKSISKNIGLKIVLEYLKKGNKTDRYLSVRTPRKGFLN